MVKAKEVIKRVLAFLLVVLVGLWFMGYVRLPWLKIPDIPVMEVMNQIVSLWDVLIFIVVVWAVGILPSPLRQIASALVVLWTLSSLGILRVAYLSQLLLLAVIVGLVVAIFQK